MTHRPLFALALTTLSLAACAPEAGTTDLDGEAIGRGGNGAASKVDVCHWSEDDQQYVLINVSSNSSHLSRHGNDSLAGDWFPDTDGDGLGDASVAASRDCPEDTSGWATDDSDLCPGEDATGYDADGDGCLDDTDGDGLTDDVDACPSEDATGYDADGDGCLDDSDGDGLTDDVDACPDTSAATADGCPVFDLIGHWTFEPGYELVDLTGNWGDLVLVDSAAVSGGALDVYGSGADTLGYARTSSYGGPDIVDKTLVSWVTRADNSAWAGAPLGIDNQSGDNFDSIVWGERSGYWFAGSSYFVRTDYWGSAWYDVTTNVQRQMAISYEWQSANEVTVTICADGAQVAQYTDTSATGYGSSGTWSAGNAEALMGIRHSDPGWTRGGLNATVEENRIYGEALTCAEVATLTPQ